MRMLVKLINLKNSYSERIEMGSCVFASVSEFSVFVNVKSVKSGLQALNLARQQHRLLRKILQFKDLDQGCTTQISSGPKFFLGITQGQN